jgi:hypothetical protein
MHKYNRSLFVPHTAKTSRFGLTCIDGISAPDKRHGLSGFNDGPKIVLSILAIAGTKSNAIGTMICCYWKDHRCGEQLMVSNERN